jgi:hypothetical protein
MNVLQTIAIVIHEAWAAFTTSFFICTLLMVAWVLQ